MLNRSTEVIRRPARRGGRLAAWLIGAWAAALLVGCFGKPLATPIQSVPEPGRFIPSYDDTIGFYGDLPVDRRTLVRGYGLALIPHPTGSRECPPGVRKIIVDQLNRMRVGETTSVLSGVRMSQWTDSLNTAVVEVRGLMPACGLNDDTFDVLVTALPGTQTTSLEGGVLVKTDLSIWRRSRTGGLIHGKVFAVASGPVFINPFAEKTVGPTTAAPAGHPTTQPVRSDELGASVGTPVDPRRAWVLGGALILKDQPINLTFREPNYRIAHITNEQLNTRFPSDYLHGVAHARSPSLVKLKVPPDYRNQPQFWLALVSQTYLRREPGFLERRTAQLADEMAWPNHSPRDRLRVAMTFAAIGKPALPVLQRLYSHENASVAFHAAYAGLRIGDSLALRVLLRMTGDQTHPYRVQAVQALGQPHRFRNIAPRLAALLNEGNPELRIAAYESMCRLGSLLISRRNVGLGRLGFELDVIRCAGPYLIYVTRSVRPRIALFGGDVMKVSRPMFLHSQRTSVTLTAKASDEHLMLIRSDPYGGRPMPTMKTSFLAAHLIRKLGGQPTKDEDGDLIGMGLNYSQVVHLLYQLSKLDLIPADVHLQQLRGPSVQLASEEIAPPPPEPIIGASADVTAGPSIGTSTPPTSQPDRPLIDVELPGDGPPKIGS